MLENFESNKKEALIFYIFYLLYAFKTLLIMIPLDDPLVDLTKNIINGFLLIIMGFSFLYIDKFFRITFLLLGVLFVLGISLEGNNGLYNYLVLVIILGITKKLSVKYISEVVLTTNVLLFLLMIPFVMIAGKFFITDMRYNQQRLTLGFSSPNVMSQYLTMVYLIISYYVYRFLYGRAIFYVITTTIFILFYYIIYLSISRTGLGIITISYLTMFLAGMYNKEKFFSGRKIYKLYTLSIVLIAASQIWMIVNFSKSPITLLLNGILAGRLELGNFLYNGVGGIPVFFGVDVNPYLPIDFNFVKMFFSLGIALSVIVIVFLLKSIKEKDYSPIGVIVIFICLISAFTESYLAVLFFNISLLLIYSKDSKI